MQALHGLCIFLVSASIPLFAQQSSTAPCTPNTPSQPAVQASGTKNRQMTLNVVVANKSGKPQSELQQEDFTLLDNNVQQKIFLGPKLYNSNFINSLKPSLSTMAACLSTAPMPCTLRLKPRIASSPQRPYPPN
jgi:hypothetical protein